MPDIDPIDEATVPSRVVRSAGDPMERGKPNPVQEEVKAPTVQPQSTGHRIMSLLRFRASRSHLIVGILCAALGFALVTQVQQAQQDPLSGMRQEDLVRILDETTTRSEQLAVDLQALQSQRDTLVDASDKEEAAREAAEQRATTQGILAGTVPVQGSGITIEIPAGSKPIPALTLYGVLEELRNAGAESVEINGARLTADSYFVDSATGVVVDGAHVSAPYTWKAIGDPDTMTVALSIPGGSVDQLKKYTVDPVITASDKIVIDSVKELEDPRFAQPDIQDVSPTPERT